MTKAEGKLQCEAINKLQKSKPNPKFLIFNWRCHCLLLPNHFNLFHTQNKIDWLGRTKTNI